MSLKTQETYTSVLSMIKRMYDTTEPNYFLDVKKVIEKLQASKYAITTQKVMIVVINTLLRDSNGRKTPEYKKAIEEYTNIITSYNNTINHIIGENIMSKKEEDKYIDYNQLLEIQKKLLEDYNKHNDEQKYFNYLILSLYILFPPRRIIDYTKMKLVETEPKNSNFNYLVYDKKKNKMEYVFNVYKTSTHYGRQSFNVPNDLRDIIKVWITLYHKGEYLLSKYGGTTEINEDTFSKIITRLLIKYSGIPAGVSMIRHSYISHITDNKNLSLNDRKDIANKMAHSIFLQLQYYRKSNVDNTNKKQPIDN